MKRRRLEPINDREMWQVITAEEHLRVIVGLSCRWISQSSQFYSDRIFDIVG